MYLLHLELYLMFPKFFLPLFIFFDHQSFQMKFELRNLNICQSKDQKRRFDGVHTNIRVIVQVNLQFHLRLSLIILINAYVLFIFCLSFLYSFRLIYFHLFLMTFLLHFLKLYSIFNLYDCLSNYLAQSLIQICHIHFYSDNRNFE